MSERFDIEVSPEVDAAIKRLGDMPGLGTAIAHEMDNQNAQTVSRIQGRYMSFPKDGPTVSTGTRVISNRLRSSVRFSKAVFTGDGIVSAIGSNVVYAGAQEFGVDETVTVRPHMRRQFKHQKVFGRMRKLRGGDIEVHGFSRHMRIEGRGMFQRGITDRLGEYSAAIGKTFLDFESGGGES
jgi:hypothetical protein